MKNKIVLILSFNLISFTLSFAQTYIYYGDKTYGTNRADALQSIRDMGNGHLIIAGNSQGNANGDKTGPMCDTNTIKPDVWILKIDTAYNIIWDKDIGGANYEGLPQLLYKKSTSQIMISESSSSDSSCEKTANNKSYPMFNQDYWIINIDTNGNIINDFTWGGNKIDGAPQTIALNSGNLITCGISNSAISSDVTVANYDSTNSTSDYWVVKSDSLGNKLWNKRFGGTGDEIAQIFNFDSQFHLFSDADENFIIAGTTKSPLSGDISDVSRGMEDIWIIKIDSAGNKIWDKRYGGSSKDVCNHIIHSYDDGYMIIGSTNSPKGGDVSDSTKGIADSWVLKLDPFGNKQWDKRYGGNGDDIATWIEKAPGGGYWISGLTSSDSSGDVSQPRYSNINDYWIFKIDESGNKLWDKRFGGPNDQQGSSFVIMPDSSIFLAGSAQHGISSVKADSGKGQVDYWIVHFKYTDSLSTSGINTANNFNKNLMVFPNPTSDLLTITSATENIKSVALINLIGETMFTQVANNARSTKLNLQAYPPGFYFVKITGSNYSVIKKVLRQ